jgi:hypothetical protein
MINPNKIKWQWIDIICENPEDDVRYSFKELRDLDQHIQDEERLGKDIIDVCLVSIIHSSKNLIIEALADTNDQKLISFIIINLLLDEKEETRSYYSKEFMIKSLKIN